MNPHIQQNPHPKMRYDITMTIEDPPGPFGSVTGFVQYEVANNKCVPEDPLAGVRVTPSTNPPITFTRISDNVYTATVYADLIKDKDYYGKGICHWSMIAVVAELKTNEVTLGPYIGYEDMASHKPNTMYFSKEFYSKSDVPELHDSGIPYSIYSTEADRSEFFAITITAKEHFE